MKNILANKSRPTTSLKKPSRLALGLVALALAGAALFGASGYYWYKNVLMDPDRILDGMLDKSLQTTSVYRTVGQSGGQNTVNQATYVAFTPETMAQSFTTLREINDLGRTTVTTETLGNDQTDYVRYNSIKIESTTKRNFDNVVNVWGKREANAETGQATSFLNDALFVIVPFGNLNPEQRKIMTDEINKVGLYDAESTKTSIKSGRPIITYDIKLDPQALVTVLAKYVEVTGIGKSANLDPASYEGATKLDVELEVDVLSRHVKAIRFANSGRTESYTSYNVVRQIQKPTETIDVNELQSRLQTLESQQ
jgi:hypothetical protein